MKPSKQNKKEAEVGTLVPDEVDFTSELVTRDAVCDYTLLEGTVCRDGVATSKSVYPISENKHSGYKETGRSKYCNCETIL